MFLPRALDRQIAFQTGDRHSGTDPLGRLVEKRYYAVGATTPSETVVYAYDVYDGAGRRHETVTDQRGVTDYAYDSEGRLVMIAAPEGTIHYDYDPATGRRIRTWTDNSDTRYAYDVLGRFTTRAIAR